VTTTGIESPHHNTREARVLSSFPSRLSEPGLKPTGLSGAPRLETSSSQAGIWISTHIHQASQKDDLNSLHNYQVQPQASKSNPTTPPTSNTLAILQDFDITTPIQGIRITGISSRLSCPQPIRCYL
jgi:hypothetical protein